ncbi:UPF0182 family protein [Yimella sp. cx-51]|uniref:UPF0182 family membrane protein n=1 Tax=Yimella sp. cx-51 TaxID=2770551 RepID=UPI001AD89E41|nr:UPF0182 family protein [Yimella sp. cx-51]QTH37388.1 UPF0182 family protein [Yimella sp. cx-51]
MSSADSSSGEGREAAWRAVGDNRGRRMRRIWFIAAITLLVAYILLKLWSHLWTEKLWFDSVGFSQVFRNQVVAQVAMFAGGFLLTAGLVYGSMALAYRRRPFLPPAAVDRDAMERYREMIEPVRSLAFRGVPAMLGLFGAAVATSQWQTPLLWWNGTDFGVRDPKFGKDVGFYVFDLPWWQFLTTMLSMTLVLAIVAGAVVHYIYGGISLTREPGSRFTSAARIHLSLAAAALVLVRAVAYWLDRYALTTKDARLITGIDYTADHAQIPTKTVLAVAAVLCAAMFVATLWTRTWRLPIIGIASMVVLAVVLGGVYPSVIANFKVNPNARALEQPYIKHNIDATRAAYGLNTLVGTSEQPETDAKPEQLRKDAQAVPGIRLVDPYLISPTFRQYEGQKQYYQFSDVLDVDRYTIDGKETDVVVGVRELDLAGVPAGQQNWVNQHTVYTHGYGMVAAYGNQRGKEGEPVWAASNMPQAGRLGKFEPRVYFGESSPSYSIVGAPAGAPPGELDYPDSSTGGERRTTYTGKGGVAIGGLFRKLAYAVKYQEYNFVLSDSINEKSRLLDVRSPAERVKKVAPWLTIDGDPYPVVAGGRLEWVIDGYTTSARYPYSKTSSLEESTEDSVTRTASNVRAAAGSSINYIRNSVKATVDAYDGSVKLYAWDEKDPVLKTWRKAFGGTVLPLSKMPEGVRAHVRYPEDLFKVQREVLANYHVSDPATFFSGTDFWQVPADPTSSTGAQQPPYYLSIAMPGVSRPTYSLSSSYIPAGKGRQNLSAFLAVDSDATPTPGKPNGNYGTLRLWTMPRNVTIKGPAQFQNDVNTSNEASSTFPQTLSVFMQANGDRLQRGNLLTLPLAGGLLYVQPLYVKASAATGFPLQRAVVVQFGNKLAWGVTLENALDDLFGSGATTGTDTPGGDTKPPTSGDTVSKALGDAQKAWDEGQAALKKGDLAGYQAAMNRVKAALDRAVKLGGTPGSSSSAATPSGSATPSSSGSTPSPSASPSATGSAAPSATG